MSLGTNRMKTFLLLESYDYWAKLKNSQHHHGKLKLDIGLTSLVFTLERTLNAAVFYLNTLMSTLGAKAAQ